MSDTQDVEALVARVEEIAAHLAPVAEYSGEVLTLYSAATALRTLARERDEAREAVRRTGVWDFPRDIQNLTVKLEAAEARASSLEAQLAGAKEVLEPFAQASLFFNDEPWGKELIEQNRITVGDLRRARAAYEALASAPASAGDHSGHREGFLAHMLAEISDESRHPEFPPTTPEASHDR